MLKTQKGTFKNDGSEQKSTSGQVPTCILRWHCRLSALYKVYMSVLSNCLVTLLEVTENFWRLSRTAKRFEILNQNFEVTSAESLNHA